MWNKDKVREVVNIDPEQVPPRQSNDLMDVWVRERKEALARQLAANADIKQPWLDSAPLEVRQNQPGQDANATVEASAEEEPIPGRNKSLKR